MLPFALSVKKQSLVILCKIMKISYQQELAGFSRNERASVKEAKVSAVLSALKKAKEFSFSKNCILSNTLSIMKVLKIEDDWSIKAISARQFEMFKTFEFIGFSFIPTIIVNHDTTYRYNYSGVTLGVNHDDNRGYDFYP